MHEQQVIFTIDEIIKYIGIVAGLIISGAGIYYLIIFTLKGMDNKIESNTKNESHCNRGNASRRDQLIDRNQHYAKWIHGKS